MWDKIKEFLAERLNEKSTLRALTVLFGFLGWKVAPEHSTLIAEVVVTLLVFFGVLPDKGESEEEKKKRKLEEAKKFVAENS